MTGNTEGQKERGLTKRKGDPSMIEGRITIESEGHSWMDARERRE
jgi:hypothetical protein